MATDVKRSRAAKKAARTRAANRAAWKRWIEIDKPAHMQTVAIANERLEWEIVRVRFIGGGGWKKLAKGSGIGTLLKVLGTGMQWRVIADGYKQPRDWHASYWEVL